MNTKNLDTFITLTKYNSINAAADALFISSPALQQQINRLESEIGFKLFERGAAGIRLTPAGETFLDGVIKLRSDTESLLARCRETDSLNKSLRVGAILGLQPDLFPRVSGPFYQKYPVIEYFDCPRAHAAGRNFEPLFWEGRDCMMSPNHPLASHDILTLDDLAGQHIIVYRFDRLPGLREYVEKSYPDIRISEDPRVMDLYTVVRSFEDGHIGLVPPHVGSQFHPLRTIPLKMDMSWPVGFVYREPRSVVLNQFIEVAKQVFSQYTK